MTLQDEDYDLWLAEPARDTLSPIASSPESELNPLWSPDGKQLYFTFDSPPYQPFRVSLQGGAAMPVWKGQSTLDTVVADVSADEKMLALTRVEPTTVRDVVVGSTKAESSLRQFRSTIAQEHFATFSPDGHWLAYESDETGRPEIWAAEFPGPGKRIQLTSDGGSEPIWSASGALFFRHDDEFHVIPTPLKGGPSQVSSRLVFKADSYKGNIYLRTYDVSADGQRFIFIRTPDALKRRRIDIVTGVGVDPVSLPERH